MKGQMRLYDFLDPRQAAADMRSYVKSIETQITDLWCDEYAVRVPDCQISEIRLDEGSYLFDHIMERTIAAYGLSSAARSEPRDKARMAGYPKSEGADYHRGHLIPHSGGGGTDINLFSQLGIVNTGAFRRLERLSLRHPNSFYFVRLIYPDGDSQRPAFVEQGLLVNDAANPRLEYAYFAN